MTDNLGPLTWGHVVILLALVIQSIGLGAFAGSIRQMLKDHDRRLWELENLHKRGE